ncbi:MAG: RNA polymerase factor sigma-32 [Myxococcales bacterium]|nr:RNA polymerase factor sigma-32 [Myxococcales bacterium]
MAQDSKPSAKPSAKPSGKPRRAVASVSTHPDRKESEPADTTQPELVDGAADSVDPSDDDAELEKLVGSAVDAIPDEDIVLAADALVTELVPDGRRSGSLVKSDPLTAYMHEIRRYPLLSREEEHELAVQYSRSRDPVIARRLITANLRLVVKIAHEYKRAYRNLLDLVQEGNLGLLQAVEKYDPHRGVKLSSYAAWWIRAYMLKFILNNWRLVKIGTTQAQRKLFFNLSKEREKLEADGFVATSKLLAERLSVPEQEVTDMSQRLGQSETSLDAPVGRDDEGGRRQVDLLESPGSMRPDLTAESEEFRALLRQKLSEFEQTLTGREKLLFQDRLMADTPLTLQDVGERFGISRERARQLEARLLGRLKVYLKKELGDAVQIAMGLD